MTDKTEPTQAEKIAAILGADPVCMGRVSMGTIEALAAMSDPALKQARDALAEVFADHDAVKRLSWIDATAAALANLNKLIGEA